MSGRCQRSKTRWAPSVPAAPGPGVRRMAARYVVTDPTRAYFGTDTRAHELLIGAALAVLLITRPRLHTDRRARKAAAFAGPVALGVVAVSFLTVDDQSAARRLVL